MGQAQATRLLLVEDDSHFFRPGLARLLEEHGFEVIEAGDAKTGWRLALQHRPDVVIVDIVIPTVPSGEVDHAQSVGVELAAKLKSHRPSLGIILLSAYPDRVQDVIPLFDRGNRGLVYQLKSITPDELLASIQAVMAGRVFIHPRARVRRTLKATLWARVTDEERPWVMDAVEAFPTLTRRELEVAQLVAASHTNAGIAAKLVIQVEVVELHITSIYAKTGLSAVKETPRRLQKRALLAKAYLLYELSLEDQ